MSISSSRSLVVSSVPSLEFWENIDSYSPLQINQHFEWVIKDIQNKTPIFSRIRELSHYVFLGKASNNVGLVSGIQIINFSVFVPTIDYVRDNLKKKEVSFFGKVTLARMAQEHFDSCCENAYKRIGVYSYLIQRLHEITSISTETLHTLLSHYEDLVEISRNHISLMSAAYVTLVQYQSQVRFLEYEIRRRKR